MSTDACIFVDDLGGLDTHIAEMTRAGRGEPLADTVPVIDDLDALATHLDDDRRPMD